MAGTFVFVRNPEETQPDYIQYQQVPKVEQLEWVRQRKVVGISFLVDWVAGTTHAKVRHSSKKKKLKKNQA